MITFESIASEIGKLVGEKNKAYGNSFEKCGEFMQILYPNGIQPEQYQDALTVVRIFDKLMRIANKKDAFGESPFRDIVGYGLLGVWKDELTPREHEDESINPGDFNLSVDTLLIENLELRKALKEANDNINRVKKYAEHLGGAFI